MNEQLVEKVARAMCVANHVDPDEASNLNGGPCWQLYTTEASAAIDLVLSEASKAASDQAQVFRDDADANRKFGNNEKYKWGMAIARFFDAHAAAILALGGKK